MGGATLAPAAFGYCSGIVSTLGVTSANETVYGNDPRQCMGFSACIGTGGGPSAFEPKPAWQSVAPCTNRVSVSPDVSILAALTSGVAVFMEGSWLDFGVGGTSLSAPLWAGIVARLDQARRALGQPALNTTASASWAFRWPRWRAAWSSSGARAMTAEGAEALAGRLARIHDVEVVAVRPHCGDRFILVSLTVQAGNPSDAVDRAVAVLRSSAAAAGVGPLVLVAARVPGF